MSNISISNKDQIIMSLVHYFVTKENYSPIVVQGAKNEIWLENLNGPYKIIRINSGYIHNDEQLEFDLAKVKHVAKQIKKRTLSLSVNTLNICVDIASRVTIKEVKAITTINITNVNEIVKNNDLINIFPKIKKELVKNANNLDLIINVTNDINNKTEKDNKIYEDVFRSKKIIITYLIIIICIIMYLLTIIIGDGSTDLNTLMAFGANNVVNLTNGEFWRLFTSIFIHYGLFHLLVNMYSLYIIGKQVENYLGKLKFLIVYIVSGISGSMLSSVFLADNIVSMGASGAIFGMLGSLLYLGYHYRLYLGNALKTQIIPIILINLIVGMFILNVDIAAHIGGLIGGYLITSAIGLKGKKDLKESLNSIIVLIIYISFLIYMILFH